jgi:signal transduction histidine kinase
MESAIQDADHLLGIFNAVLAISQAETSSRLNHFEVLDPSLLVQDVAELYEPLAQEKDQTLTIEVERGMSIFGDRHLLFQTFANVVDNAVKYTPSGGTILICAKNFDNGVNVSVTDTGPGIPEADRDRVLDRFVRLDSTRTSPGNGLGLSLVRAVASLHNAHLQLDDNGPGLCLSLTFPKTVSQR